jgi:hypothetical protein
MHPHALLAGVAARHEIRERGPGWLRVGWRTTPQEVIVSCADFQGRVALQLSAPIADETQVSAHEALRLAEHIDAGALVIRDHRLYLSHVLRGSDWRPSTIDAALSMIRDNAVALRALLRPMPRAIATRHHLGRLG